MDEIKEQLISIISNCLNGNSENSFKFDDDEITELGKFAARHDLEHFIGYGISKGFIDTSEEKRNYYTNRMYSVAVRMERIDYEFNAICSLLEENSVHFIPLKGSVIKNYYPERWMRTSCDIDILVNEEDIERAISAINSEDRFTVGKRRYHDISLVSKNKINIELHFSIKEDMDNIDTLLKDAWEYAVPKENHRFYMHMTPEFFMFHIYAHTSYHFLHGGCGIRTLIDVYLLEKSFGYDKLILDGMLEKTGILFFRDELKLLSEVWFGGKVHNELTRVMQDFIFSGGVYGSLKNRLAINGCDKTPAGYFLERVWAPYDTMKKAYPVLNKHKYLLPLCQIKRWFGFIFSNRHKARVHEIKTFNSFEAEKKEKTDYMLKSLKLKGD